MHHTKLHKESRDNFEAKSVELSKAVEELQRMLGDASVRFGDLESESKAEIDHLKGQLATSSKKIADQKKELDLANGLIDATSVPLLTNPQKMLLSIAQEDLAGFIALLKLLFHAFRDGAILVNLLVESFQLFLF